MVFAGSRGLYITYLGYWGVQEHPPVLRHTATVLTLQAQIRPQEPPSVHGFMELGC